MNNKLDRLISLLKEDLQIIFSVSLGVFLFVLFFEPFPLNTFDFNNKLLFVAGLGTIVFLFTFIVRITLPWLLRNAIQSNHDYLQNPVVITFLILAFTSVGFAFYLHYVGNVVITFYLMFKVALICLTPLLIIQIYDTVRRLKQQNASLIKEKKVILKLIEKYEDDYLNKSIEFISDNNTENLTLLNADVTLIKSADNYVEIVYKEGAIFKKKLLRNTLKNIELQIKPYSNFIRCHRICIVNIHYIEKLHRSYNNHWLILKGYEEQIPVSRQYLLKIKEIL